MGHNIARYIALATKLVILWTGISVYTPIPVKGRGTGTATIEAKLAQQLAFIKQEALYSTFINLQKAYDAMDRERCLEILKGYGVGPNMLRLITAFWDMAVLVCRAGGRYGTPFQAIRGVTQGGP